jgi:hypothetical protein
VHRRIAIAAAGCLVLAGLAVALHGQQKAADKAAKPWVESFAVKPTELATTGENTYFVLKPGYVLTLEGKEDGKAVRLVITVLDETKLVGGVETRVVEERETQGGALAEVSRNYFAIEKGSNSLYYFGEDVDIYKGDKVVHEGAWHAGEGGAKHGILIPGAIKLGDRYYQEQAPGMAMDRAGNVSTNQTVTTPAGVFEHCLKTKETTPLDSGTGFKFYAPGIGLVQDGSLKLVKHSSMK